MWSIIIMMGGPNHPITKSLNNIDLFITPMSTYIYTIIITLIYLFISKFNSVIINI